MKALFMSRMVFVSFLMVVVSGCVSERSLSKKEADAFVERLSEFERLKVQAEEVKDEYLPFQEYLGIGFPERWLHDLLEENLCPCDSLEEGYDTGFSGKRLSSWHIEDFLYSDSKILHLGARNGKYPFYKDGMVIWKHHTIPVLQHDLPWNFSLRLVTPLNVSEADRAGGASQWGLVVRKKF